MGLEKGPQLLPDELRPAGHVALYIDRQNGVVDRQPHQKPPLPLPLGKGHPDALVVVWGDLPSLLPGVGLQGGNDRLSPGPEVLLYNGDADLYGLCRLPQGGQQVLKTLALLAKRGQLDNNSGDQIGPVVQEIVLLKSGVAAGLNGKRTGDARPVQPQRLVDDIFVAPLKTVMSAAQCVLNKAVQPVGGNGVGDNGAAGGPLQGNGRGHGHQAVPVDLPAGRVHHTGPVHVCVENNAQVCLRLCYHTAGRGHGLLVLRVGDVIGKIAVGV